MIKFSCFFSYCTSHFFLDYTIYFYAIIVFCRNLH
nr:MAG TPA_asm: hypothetical protein [Caudoviricetes sp.]